MEWEDLAEAARARGLTLERLEEAGWRDQAVWEYALLVVRELTLRGLLPAHQAADRPDCFADRDLA
ncbi:hypothetical protein [Oceanithermus profundus]|uniref:Uncharacterized protein n=1 Tax=Oceanithermus profundus (strain DSM 14977 / NBRC 100410 / VKM B-2274 / 506) TaxID=670487 RepID=E4U8G1_OCEP5|nr:hypothetical protein [Oceanithermus profundus]ADR36641.1 hypothetical protein Ocepr_1184 [Oceanithermus profundus DSM 14977]